jgi:CBS domain-containing protein
MMNIESLIETDLPSVYAYASTEVVKKKLVEEYTCMKVIDEDDRFLGLITAKDIFRHPYHLVIDCLWDKPTLQPKHTIYEAIRIMIQRGEDAAHVFTENNEFLGAIRKDNLTEYLLRYTLHLENIIIQEKQQQ